MERYSNCLSLKFSKPPYYMYISGKELLLYYWNTQRMMSDFSSYWTAYQQCQWPVPFFPARLDRYQDSGWSQSTARSICRGNLCQSQLFHYDLLNWKVHQEQLFLLSDSFPFLWLHLNRRWEHCLIYYFISKSNFSL